MSEGMTELRTIRLEDLPVASLLEARRHLDNLLQEFRVIASGITTGALDAEVPRRLSALIEEINERFASERLMSRRLVDEAAEQGEKTLTIELQLPVEAAAVVEQYCQLLDAADEYCRRGELLTLALPAELAEFRRELLKEIVRQLG